MCSAVVDKEVGTAESCEECGVLGGGEKGKAVAFCELLVTL